MHPPRLFIFARHAESTANVSGQVSSDPTRSVALTRRGQAQALDLGAQLAGIDIDLAVTTRFERTRSTAQLALRDRAVPILTDPDLDEIQAGDLDAHPLKDYWGWKETHAPAERFPNGESVAEARQRYAAALRRLLSRTEQATLVILHELALRWVVEGAVGSASPPRTTFANAMPYLLGEPAVGRAVARLEQATVTGSPGENHGPGVGSGRPLTAGQRRLDARAGPPIRGCRRFA